MMFRQFWSPCKAAVFSVLFLFYFPALNAQSGMMMDGMFNPYGSHEVVSSGGWIPDHAAGLTDYGVDLFHKDAQGVQPFKEPGLIEIVFRIKKYLFDLPVCDWLTGKREPLQDLIDEADYIGGRCYIPLKAGRAYTVPDALDLKGLEVRAWRDPGSVVATQKRRVDFSKNALQPPSVSVENPLENEVLPAVFERPRTVPTTDSLLVQKVNIENYALKLGDIVVLTSAEQVNLAFIKLRSNSTPGQFTITGDGAFRGVVFDLEPGMQLETVAAKLDFTDVYIRVREDSELYPDTGFAQKRRPGMNLDNADSYARVEGVSSAPVDAGETKGNGQSGEVTTDRGSGNQMPSGSGASGGGEPGGASGGSGGDEKKPDDNKDKVEPAKEDKGKKRKKKLGLNSFRKAFGLGKNKQEKSLDSPPGAEEQGSSRQSGTWPRGRSEEPGAVGGGSEELTGLTQKQAEIEQRLQKLEAERSDSRVADRDVATQGMITELNILRWQVNQSQDQLQEAHNLIEALQSNGVRPVHLVPISQYEDLKQKEAELEVKNKELEDSREQVKGLQTQCQDQACQLEERNNEINRKKKDLEELQKENEQLKKELAKKNDESAQSEEPAQDEEQVVGSRDLEQPNQEGGDNRQADGFGGAKPKKPPENPGESGL